MMERDDEYERAVGYPLMHYVLEFLSDRAQGLENRHIRSVAARLESCTSG